jgi:hypothetical protein
MIFSFDVLLLLQTFSIYDTIYFFRYLGNKPKHCP